MKVWYTDTSALLKRYVKEAGSDWLRGELIRCEVIISHLTPIELTAALGRRYQLGNISKFIFYQARRGFMDHYEAGIYRVINWQQPLYDEAMRLTFHKGLRAYDAVQLAAALLASKSVERSRFTFLTADSALEKVAQAEGLSTENPLRH